MLDAYSPWMNTQMSNESCGRARAEIAHGFSLQQASIDGLQRISLALELQDLAIETPMTGHLTHGCKAVV